MITTVTTTTVTAFAAASLTLIAILALLVLLVNKELITSSSNEKARRFSRALNVAVVPLALVFGVTVVMKLIQLLG
jgi:hypothetical protein